MKCNELAKVFNENNIDFYSGVPDSTFKDWMKYLADEHGNSLTNIIAANECEAIATATGHYLRTGNIGVVYMQNSGEGKAVNPITSLCDPEVYSIPLIMMIGWRGEPGKKDEPQHKKMGRVMLPLLDTLEIPYKILPADIGEAAKVIAEIKNKAVKESRPVALIIKKGTFEEYEAKTKVKTTFEMVREDAIITIAEALDPLDAIISTTGKTSRELYEFRTRNNQPARDFLTVGSMGCSASIANGIALADKSRKIFVFDGDGAVIMQMGALATIGSYGAENLYHVVFDNASYESTGGQPTVSPSIQLDKIALACGYKGAQIVETKADLTKAIIGITKQPGPQMLIVKVNKGSRKDLGRPASTPVENKKMFMEYLSK